MASLNHVHKLKRHTYKKTGTKIFFCTLPRCTYKNDTKLSLGKESVCWRCGETFIMNDYSIRLDKPHCPACHKTREDPPNLKRESSSSKLEPTGVISDLKSRLRAVEPVKEGLEKDFSSMFETAEDSQDDLL